jgi:hypothetical protein
MNEENRLDLIEKELEIAESEIKALKKLVDSLQREKQIILKSKYENVWILSNIPEGGCLHEVVGIFSSEENARQYIPEGGHSVESMPPGTPCFKIHKGESKGMSLIHLDVPYPLAPKLRSGLAKPYD